MSSIGMRWMLTDERPSRAFRPPARAILSRSLLSASCPGAIYSRRARSRSKASPPIANTSPRHPRPVSTGRPDTMICRSLAMPTASAIASPPVSSSGPASARQTASGSTTQLGHEIDSTFVLSGSLFQQSDKLAALADAQLGVDRAEMVPNCVIGDRQTRSNRLVGQPRHGEINQLPLPLR